LIKSEEKSVSSEEYIAQKSVSSEEHIAQSRLIFDLTSPGKNKKIKAEKIRNSLSLKEKNKNLPLTKKKKNIDSKMSFQNKNKANLIAKSILTDEDEDIPFTQSNEKESEDINFTELGKNFHFYGHTFGYLTN
jgi:hypothetical protein